MPKFSSRTMPASGNSILKVGLDLAYHGREVKRLRFALGSPQRVEQKPQDGGLLFEAFHLHFNP